MGVRWVNIVGVREYSLSGNLEDLLAKNLQILKTVYRYKL